MAKGKRPRKKATGTRVAKPSDAGHDTSSHTPKFCLHHLRNGYCLDELDRERRADFAMALFRRRSMTWLQIIQADRHGLGLETIPVDRIKPDIPGQFVDADKFVVLRYSDRLPMVGVRRGDTFHVIWVEKNYGDVYDHGS